jgi:MYXO-CTERM domain-containing protein
MCVTAGEKQLCTPSPSSGGCRVAGTESGWDGWFGLVTLGLLVRLRRPTSPPDARAPAALPAS